MNGLIVDNFAGGGGASEGIRLATGREPDYAINHDAAALEMHAANHSGTHHLCESVWAVDPVALCAGRPVELAWFSPDCRHFSRAKGGAKCSARVRCLAWIAVKWAKLVRPKIIILENVPEFVEWGPPDGEMRPVMEKRGKTFQRFVAMLKNLGYQVAWRMLNAADFGAPTCRRRFFLVARCDGRPIQWPAPTHARLPGLFGLLPWVAASSVIDWSIPCPSIFGRPRPLAEKTMARIARGVEQFVMRGDPCFLMHVSHGENGGTRCQSLSLPTPTQAGTNQHALVMAFLTKFYGTSTGAELPQPMPVITGGGHGGHHLGLVYTFLIKYFGCGVGQRADAPLHTVTSRDRFGLVTVHGEAYRIADIGLRMLQPRELALAQGFGPGYILTGNKTNQVHKIGNSVCPPVAAAIVRANTMPAHAVAAGGAA